MLAIMEIEIDAYAGANVGDVDASDVSGCVARENVDDATRIVILQGSMVWMNMAGNDDYAEIELDNMHGGCDHDIADDADALGTRAVQQHGPSVQRRARHMPLWSK